MATIATKQLPKSLPLDLVNGDSVASRFKTSLFQLQLLSKCSSLRKPFYILLKMKALRAVLKDSATTRDLHLMQFSCVGTEIDIVSTASTSPPQLTYYFPARYDRYPSSLTSS